MSFARRIPRAIRVSTIGLLILLAAGLVAFGPRSATPSPDDRTVVVYWEKWTDFEGAAMRDLVDHFNETVGRDRGIYVDYIATTNIDFKTLISAAGGDPPDLAGLWQRNLHSFAAGGALEPLDDRARAAGIDADTLLPVFERGCRYHGRLYAIPLTPASIALYYNKDVFAQFARPLRAAGLDPDRPPRTLDELSAFARVLHRRNDRDDIEMMAYLPGLPESFGWFWDTWPIWFGGRPFDPRRGEFRVDTDVYIRAYEWVQDYVQRFGRREVARFESGLGNFNSPDNPFMSGKLAMVRQGPWFANMIRKFAPEIHYGVAPFPTIDGREVAYCEQDILVIPRGSRHPEEAWAFVEWLYTADRIRLQSGTDSLQWGYDYCEVLTDSGVHREPMPALRPVEWLCWMHCKNSPLLTPTPAFLRTHPNPAIAVHDRLARGPNAVMTPPLPNWVELHAEFVVAYRDILLTGVPAAERLRQCQARLDVLTALARRHLQRYGVAYP